MRTKLPTFLKSYFWDVDFYKLDPQEYPEFVLKRVIDRGDTQALRWALSCYPLESIKNLVLKSRDLSRKTANFWARILGLSPLQVPCLQKPYSRTPFGP